MGVAYRSILKFETKDSSLSDLAAYVTLWLVGKGWEVPTESGQIAQNRFGATLTYTEVSTPYFARRWTLSETWDIENVVGESEVSITSVSVLTKGSENWVWIEIETPEKKWFNSKSGVSNVEPAFASTPGIVHQLIEELKPYDGRLPIFKEPPVIDTEDALAAIVLLIQDATRFGSLYVTTPPYSVTDLEWQATIFTQLRDCRGMGSAFVISKRVLAKFNEMMGYGLSISPGSIRTYQPGAELDDPGDWHKHRNLSYKTHLEKSSHRVGRILRAAQVLRMRTSPIPSFLLEVERSLTRRLRFGFETPNPELSEPYRNSEDRTYLDIAKLYEEEAAQQKFINEELKYELEFLAEDNDLLADELDLMRRKCTFLQKKLIESGEVVAAYEDPAIDQLPETFEDLLEEMKSLPHLVFAGHRDPVLRLDGIQTLKSALVKAWATLKTLSDYAVLKNEGKFRRSFNDYIRDSSHGGFVGITRVKLESETVHTNPSFGAQRQIKVPPEVSASGIAFCELHVTLSKSGGAPTLYFFDATSLNGKVFIGHLGVHLDNTLTS